MRMLMLSFMHRLVRHPRGSGGPRDLALDKVIR
jgi:hypothetical protein